MSSIPFPARLRCFGRLDVFDVPKAIIVNIEVIIASDLACGVVRLLGRVSVIAI